MVEKTEQSLSPSLTLLVPVFVLLSDVITNAGSKLLTDKHQARRPGPATRPPTSSPPVQACQEPGHTAAGELEHNALESSRNHPTLHLIPAWKNCLPQNQSLVLQRLETADLEN